MADEKSVQNGIEFIKGTRNILLVAPHGVETPPLDDENSAELTREIQRHLDCDAIINPTFRKPDDTKKSKRNGGVHDIGNEYLDLNKVAQATLHQIFIPKLKEIVDKNSSTYVFWIHGIDDKNIKKGIDCYIGYGQPNSKAKPEKLKEARYTATQETIEGFLTQLNNTKIKTVLAPEASIYRGWSRGYMNQWARIEGYTLEQVQSIQLEFKYTGIREKGCIQSAGIKIAKAISKLLSVPFLPMDDMDDEKVEKAYKHLKSIFIKHFQNAMLECGKYLIQTFYGGNYELAQEKKFTSNKSLSKLIKRIQKDATEQGNAPSRTWLYDAVNLVIDYHRYKQNQLPSVYGQLGHSHKVKLISAPDEVKSDLVQEAFDKEYTVAELRDRIREEKEKLDPDRVSLKEAMNIKKLGTLKPKQLKTLKDKTEGLVKKVQDEVKLYQGNLALIEQALSRTGKSKKTPTGFQEWTRKENNINISTGCTNDCKYCYAKSMAYRFKRVKKGEWVNEQIREADVNKKRKLYAGRVGFPTSHDITPTNIDAYLEVLEKLLVLGNEILIVSKPNFDCIKRICDVGAAYKDKILFRFTIGAMDEEILHYWDTNAPLYEERKTCLKYAHDNDFQTSVSMEPLLDSSRVVEMVADLCSYVSDAIWIGKMNHIARLRTNAQANHDQEMLTQLELIEQGQTDKKIVDIYEDFQKHPELLTKLKWKDSYKKVLGLGKPPAPGMDI